MSFDTFESVISPARRKARARHARNSGIQTSTGPDLSRAARRNQLMALLSRFHAARHLEFKFEAERHRRRSAPARGRVRGRQEHGRAGRTSPRRLAAPRGAAGARCFDVRVVSIVVSWSFSVFPRKNRAHSAGRKNWGAERMATSMLAQDFKKAPRILKTRVHLLNSVLPVSFCLNCFSPVGRAFFSNVTFSPYLALIVLAFA